MDRHGVGGVNGGALHRMVAERVGRQPHRVDWRLARDLGLILTLATAGPLAVFAVCVGSDPLAVWSLIGVTAAAGLGAYDVLGRESVVSRLGVEAVPMPVPLAASRRTRVELRVVPPRHAPAPAAGHPLPLGVSQARRLALPYIPNKNPGVEP